MTPYQIITLIIGALLTFSFGLLTYRIHKADKKREEREQRRDDNMLYLISCVNTSLDFCEAIAIAQKTGKSNGETDAARVKANKIRCDYRDFLIQQGVRNVQ